MNTVQSRGISPAISIWGNIISTPHSIKIFIIALNNPKVTIISGNVKSLRRGRIIELPIQSTKPIKIKIGATSEKLFKSALSVTPLIKRAAKYIAPAFDRTFSVIFNTMPYSPLAH